MNLKFEKFRFKNDEYDTMTFYDKLKKRNSFNSLQYWIAIIFLLFINYYLFLNYVVLNLHNDVLLRNDQWLSIQKHNRKNCTTKSAFNQSTLNKFKDIIEYFNKKHDLNYFMCFSSLYFTVKVEGYDVFNSKIENILDNKNSIYNRRSEHKCVHQEFSLNISQTSIRKTRIHLCYLGTFLKEKYFCDVVQKFESFYKIGANCEYNQMTGEYMIMIGKEIQLIFHEYNIGFKSLKFLSDSFFSKEKKTDNDVEFFEENAHLNQGLLGKIFPNQYFTLPRHFFYSKFYTSDVKSNYVNYLGVPIRLPSEIINYFMLFYSSIWYF